MQMIYDLDSVCLQPDTNTNLLQLCLAALRQQSALSEEGLVSNEIPHSCNAVCLLPSHA